MNMKKILILVLLALLIFTVGCKKKSLEQLVAEGKLEKAEKYCKNQEGEKQKESFVALATHYNRENNFQKAAELYVLAGDHIRVIDSYFMADLDAEAEKYCLQQTGEVKKNCSERIAGKFYFKGNFEKAIQYYTLAGNNKMVSSVSAKIPVFQLIRGMEEQEKSVKEKGVKRGMAKARETLRAYIYIDKKSNWRAGTDSEPDKIAAGYCGDAIKMIGTEAAPVYVEKIKAIIEKGEWTEQSIQAISYYHDKLKSLLDVVSYLHKIARYRNFFTKHSKVYRESPEPREEEGSKAVNYEQAYTKALFHVKGLFETIRLAGEVKDTGGDSMKDFRDDFAIDMQVIDYIATMLKNLRLRVNDIKSRGKRLAKSSEDKAVKDRAEKVLWDFVAQCNHVLYLIGKQDYKQANQILTTAYDKAKGELK